jgi:bifunctional UDP-N-acetylglucosamine pyrophosphorylase/glucosamine-1-phosphate N-acetyltransferase
LTTQFDADMSTTAIILAAGKSTRMKSRRAKPLHEICGKPMLAWVLDACFAANCDRVIVVVGHGKDDVIAQFGHDERIQWVEQTEQLGTGHAAMMCRPQLVEHPGDVFILAGDGPLIRAQVLRTLLQTHRHEHAAASMATAILDDPTGYGRVLRSPAGEFLEIVEQADGAPEQLEIREVFPSYYCIKSEELLYALSKLTNANKKHEYYLTDIFAILRKAGKKIAAIQAVTADEVLAVNDRRQQADVDAVMQERIQRALREAGVSIASGVNAYIEADVTIGADTIVNPFTFIGRGATIGPDCVIGPFAAVPRDAVVPEATTIRGNISPASAG